LQERGGRLTDRESGVDVLLSATFCRLSLSVP
jgi:hypothetical protein